MEKIFGIGLAAGQGIRFRPLTLKAKGYLRAKAAVHFVGGRIMDWIIKILKCEGIDDYILITKGKENRYQIKNIVGYGEHHEVRIRYSPVRYDDNNVGSGDSLITNLDHFNVDGTAFVFPTDSILDINIQEMLKFHKKNNAVVTIAAAKQPAELIAGRYGLIISDENGHVNGFIEKPTLEQIYTKFTFKNGERINLPPLLTNAGFYMIDTRRLREISKDPMCKSMRQERLDIGEDLLAWLVAAGYPVYVNEIGRMGDLGNIKSYLNTMVDTLTGKFASMKSLMCKVDNEYQQRPSIENMIDQESLDLTDPITNLTLTQKIDQGLVKVISPVRIGKYVQIYPGAILHECNIDDDCEIFENVSVIRSSLGAGSMIGPHSYVEDTLTGTMVKLHSTKEKPVEMRGYVALGDEVVICGGVKLSDGVTIHPRLKVPAGVCIPAHKEVENAEMMLEYL
jgi:NDP-sugar pyrophosphorylase family protein